MRRGARRSYRSRLLLERVAEVGGFPFPGRFFARAILKRVASG